MLIAEEIVQVRTEGIWEITFELSTQFFSEPSILLGLHRGTTDCLCTLFMFPGQGIYHVTKSLQPKSICERLAPTPSHIVRQCDPSPPGRQRY